MLFLLDTDIASYIIKGRSPALAAKLRTIPPDRVCISVLTRAELIYGLMRLPRSNRLQMAVRQFLNIVRLLPWGPDAADKSAEIRHQLTESGHTIGEIDMMIAAHAVALGATLVTNNARHFRRIELPLDLVDWSDG